MELISLGTKENFFDVDVSEYSKARVNSTNDDNEFALDSEF